MRLAWLLPSNASLPVTISWNTAPNAKISVRGSAASPFELFRRHVLERTENRPLLRQARWRCRQHREARRDSRCGCLCETEIEQFRARFGEHDVARLEITVDDAGAMGGREGIRNLNSDLQRLIERQRTFLEALLQRLALQYSMTRKSISPWLPTSKTGQMCGWLSAASVLASRSNRCFRSGLEATWSGRTLTATVRWSRVSVAL